MAVPILMVTPNSGFGELICQILEETGEYALALATNEQEAVSISKKDKPAVCILETEFEGVDLKNLVDALRQEVKDLLLLLVPPNGDAPELSFEEFSPDGILAKPFYLPDLVTKVEEIIKNSGVENLSRVKTTPLSQLAKKPGAATDLPPAPEWLQDVSVAAQHLARLSLESSSQATLITKADQIWAYAGELSQPAAEELAQAVASYFIGGSSDLARFIGLEATGGEYMLYATGLGGDYVLAMVFDAEMPFSKIRSQANNLSQALSTQPPGSLSDTSLMEPGSEEIAGSERAKSPQPLLDDIPPPIPGDWIPESMVPDGRKGFLDELLEEDSSSGEDTFNYETTPVQQMGTEQEPHPVDLELDMIDVSQDQSQETGMADETMVSEVDRPGSLDETVVSRATKVDRATKLEPVSPSVYNLTYACVIVPRFPHHHLTGNIAARLADWIGHMSVAFGWRLEHLSIRPDYMQWLVNVPPNTSPGYLMRTIRQHTSRRMFVEFPVLEEENPSGDFWAPGYLIMSGNQPPPGQLVKEFIRNTRKRQGLTK